tara:strand:+ start:127 stop:747 length:621 start_codon:yes stop_codon:yes gene_type:complete
MATAKSITMKRINKVGKQIQKAVGSVIKGLGVEHEKPPVVSILEAPTATMNIDFSYPYEKVFIEVTSCMKDAKFAKIVLQCKNIKKQFPGYKTVLFVAQQASNAMSYIGHCESSPFIDEVIYFKKGDWKLLQDLKVKIKEVFDPFFEKILEERITKHSELIKKSVNSGLEPCDDAFHPVIVDKRMKKYLKNKNIEICDFVTTGNLN